MTSNPHNGRGHTRDTTGRECPCRFPGGVPARVYTLVPPPRTTSRTRPPTRHDLARQTAPNDAPTPHDPASQRPPLDRSLPRSRQPTHRRLSPRQHPHRMRNFRLRHQALMHRPTALTEAKQPGPSNRRSEAGDPDDQLRRTEVHDLEPIQPIECIHGDAGLHTNAGGKVAKVDVCPAGSPLEHSAEAPSEQSLWDRGAPTTHARCTGRSAATDPQPAPRAAPRAVLDVPSCGPYPVKAGFPSNRDRPNYDVAKAPMPYQLLSAPAPATRRRSGAERSSGRPQSSKSSANGPAGPSLPILRANELRYISPLDLHVRHAKCLDLSELLPASCQIECVSGCVLEDV